MGDKSASTLVGTEGATSVKAEIVARMPQIKDAAQFRQARTLLKKDLGGSPMLLRELIFSGFVNQDNYHLTTEEKPFNVFARIAAGKTQQPDMEREQRALGEYKDRFVICRNLPENDIHWDSTATAWVGKASMACRHRFLTTKKLHFQWFNLLVFGLVHSRLGGVPVSEAVKELEAMKAACLKFAKNVGGWSAKIGLYVNIFGHNSVNSLFIHILDMSKTGPSFKAQEFKNCPLDDVIKVLKEEARQNIKEEPFNELPLKNEQLSQYTFTGKDGATSLKAELTVRVPVLRDAATYRAARRLVREELGGVQTLREELCRAGFVDRKTDHLTTGSRPFNIFARLAAGVQTQDGFEEEQKALGKYADRFCICKNLPANDVHWDSSEPEWLGKASMSRRHRFLVVKDPHWSWFNALVFGMLPDDAAAKNDVGCAIMMLESAQEAAQKYTSASGWSSNIGMYFHVFGHNNVNSFHMHILDLDTVGPTYWHYQYKNCPLNVILKVLREEKSAMAMPHQEELKLALEAATVAAMAAKSFSYPSEAGGSTSSDEIIELNVGGLEVTLSKATLMLAPASSMLRTLFQGSWESPEVKRDVNGRIFLDYPPRSFARLMDHLRLLRLIPRTRTVERPRLAKDDEEWELMALATSLGIQDLLVGPQTGKLETAPRQDEMPTPNGGNSPAPEAEEFDHRPHQGGCCVGYGCFNL